MKKLAMFSVFLMVFGAFGGAAFTADCYRETTSGELGPKYMVYFGVDKDSIDDKNCENGLKTNLNQINIDRCHQIILLGNTSATGTWNYNAKLSQRRVKFVKGLFNEKLQGKIIERESSKTFPVNAGKLEENQDYRMVEVFVTSEYCDAADATVDNSGDDEVVTPLPVVDTTQMNNTRARINNAVSKMSELQQSFGVSAWKTAEGKFNTSRLVSDSVAGVVLGTAGGLITSNIIKKNQIRSGFEDLSCTVGGQVVAEWGDDFSVGIR